jgi:NADH:ubiquinone oxidoreductase subunit E
MHFRAKKRKVGEKNISLFYKRLCQRERKRHSFLFCISVSCKSKGMDFVLKQIYREREYADVSGKLLAE